MADASGRALDRKPLSLAVPRAVMAAVAQLNVIRQSLGGSVQILTPGKVDEIFHSDWTAHDRRLTEALGFHPRFDLATGFVETILWYRRQGWL